MDGVNWKLECEVSLGVVVTEGCCKISREMYIARIGEQRSLNWMSGD